MKRTMTGQTLAGVVAVLSGLAALPAASAVAEDVFTGADLNRPFTVHGRLRCHNGTPSMRIWIVGTQRILGVSERQDEGAGKPAIPPKIRDIFDDGKGWFTKDVFADFLVEPFEPDKPGVMRPVRILDATSIVVTLNGDVIRDDRARRPEPASRR